MVEELAVVGLDGSVEGGVARTCLVERSVASLDVGAEISDCLYGSGDCGSLGAYCDVVAGVTSADRGRKIVCVAAIRKNYGGGIGVGLRFSGR